MKLPGIYAAYALFLAIFGQTQVGIHAGLLVINAITIIAVFLLAKEFMNSLTAVASATCFALLSVSPTVYGIFLHAEHFVIVFAVFGLFVMLRALKHESFPELFLAGLLLGTGFLMKQHGLAFIGFSVLYIVYDSLMQHPSQFRLLLLRLLSFGVGVTAVLVCLCLIMAWTGVFSSFWFWTVDYAYAYISQVSPEQAWQGFTNRAIPIFQSASLIWIFVGFALIALATKKGGGNRSFFIVTYAIFSVLAICPGFYFRQHYFILLLPCASLLAGMAAKMLTDFLSRSFSRLIQYSMPILLFFTCIGQSLYLQREILFNMTPQSVSRSIYPDNPFTESLEIADFIRKHTNPEDYIAIIGSEPQIFFYSHRHSASGYIYMYPLMEKHIFALQMQKDFITNIETKKPKYLLIVNAPDSWCVLNPNSFMTLFDWINPYTQKNYRLAGMIELFSDNRALYHWGPQVKSPLSSQCWISIHERKV